MKKIVYTLFFVFLFSEIYSQSDPIKEFENLQKYWYYRFRLKNDFLLVGDCQGCSVPANTRNQASAHTLYYGDGATSDLGWYIGVLATEYKLLSDMGQPTDTTVMELFYALEAFNRFDNTAESFVRCNCSNPVFPSPGDISDLNGFFIRDETPENFIDPQSPNSNYFHFNQSIASTSMVDNIDGRLTGGPPHGAPDFRDYESIDQLIHLLMGLSLVNKFVPFYVNYPGHIFMDNDAFILSEARAIADRTVGYMKDGGNNPWTVDDPVSGALVGYAQGAQLSYGFAEATCKITDINNGTHALTGTTCSKYHDATSILNEPLFEVLQIPIILAGISPSPDSYNDHLVGILAAIGNSWYSSLPSSYILPPPFLFNTTNASLSTFFTTFHYREYIPLLRKVLHDGDCDVNNDTYDALLNSAPACGPWNYSATDHASYDWTTHNRFRDPENRGVDLSLEGQSGEFHGLDYMLLYNLYSIAYPDNVFPFINKMDINSSENYPFTISSGPPPDITIGSHSTPAFGYEFNSIKYGGHVFLDGDVTMRAGREIELTNGFGVDQGGNYGAYIDPLNCGGLIYFRTNQNSSDTSKHYVSNNPVHLANIHNSPSVSSATSTATSINKPTFTISQPQINISPNPTSGFFTLQLDANTRGEIFIYNSLGQVVHQSTNQLIHQSTIDLSSHPKGIYFVKVQTADKIYTEKIVMQ